MCDDVSASVVEDIIKRERPDGILVSFGGQTALNVCIELWRSGFLQKHHVRVLGTDIDTIIATEDREIFSKKLNEIGEKLALSYPATNLEEALTVAEKVSPDP